MLHRLQIYGNADYDYVYGKASPLTETEIVSLCDSGIISNEWNGDSVIVANFNSNLKGNEFSDTAIGYKIQRVDLSTPNLLKTVVNNTSYTRIEDFNVKNGHTYQYYIIPIYSNEGVNSYGYPIITDPITISYDYVTVAGLIPTDNPEHFKIDKNNIWNFKFNLDNITYNIKNKKEFNEGYGQYPYAHSTELNYLTGTVKSLVGDVDCANDYIEDNIEKLEKWRAFCSNNQLKLFRDRKGHILMVDIHDSSYTPNEKVLEMATDISFQFTELKNISECSVYSEEV